MAQENRVEGRDVDRLRTGFGDAQRRIHISRFCIWQTVCRPLRKTQNIRRASLLGFMTQRLAPVSFKAEPFALGLTKSSYESLERKKVSGFFFKEWEAQKTASLQSTMEPSRCENSPEAPNTFLVGGHRRKSYRPGCWLWRYLQYWSR